MKTGYGRSWPLVVTAIEVSGLPRRYDMKPIALLPILSVCAIALLHAGEAEDALKAAVTKLSEAPNYTWVSSTDISGAPMRLSPTTGKTEKGGFTVLGTEAFDQQIEVVKHGTNGVVKADEGWVTAAELPQPNFGGGGMPNMSAMLGRRLLAAKPPGEEADSLLKKLKPLKKEADGVSGEFTDDGIKDFLRDSRRGRNFTEPKSAKGSVRFWIRDGAITKGEINFESEVETPQGAMNMAVRTTTEIKDIGSTKVAVPAEAKKKLGL
jgi:hypothetical protein